MKFSEIWYVDASQQKKCYKKPFLDFGLFWPLFNQKTAKIDQNEERVEKGLKRLTIPFYFTLN